MSPRVGLLALQGDVREHRAALVAVGADPVPVRLPADLADLDGIVLPGGESTAIGLLLERVGLLEPLRDALGGGLPAYGSCAGMILLADEVLDGRVGQPLLGGLDIVVRRNAFGRQVESFEGDVAFTGLPADGEHQEGLVHAVFIRAPWVERVGTGVSVLARVPAGAPAADRIVAVRQGALLATAFHPELTGDLRVHRLFVADVVGAGRRG